MTGMGSQKELMPLMKVTVTSLTPDFGLWHHSLNSGPPSPCTVEDGTCTLLYLKQRWEITQSLPALIVWDPLGSLIMMHISSLELSRGSQDLESRQIWKVRWSEHRNTFGNFCSWVDILKTIPKLEYESRGKEQAEDTVRRGQCKIQSQGSLGYVEVSPLCCTFEDSLAHTGALASICWMNKSV